MKSFFLLFLIASAFCQDTAVVETKEGDVVNDDTLLGGGFGGIAIVQPQNLVQPMVQNQSMMPNPYLQQRNNLFNVSLNEPHHPSNIFVNVGNGFNEIRQASSSIKVIYFAEEMSNNNLRYYMAPPRKFFIVFSLTFGRERFIGAECMLDSNNGNRLMVQQALFINNLNMIKNLFKINHFPMQMQNSYTNLKQNILKNALMNQNNSGGNRYTPVYPQQSNYNDPANPIKALFAGYKVLKELKVENVQRIELLNYSKHNKERVYLFGMHSRNHPSTFLAIRARLNFGNLNVVGTCHDNNRKRVLNYLRGVNIDNNYQRNWPNLRRQLRNAINQNQNQNPYNPYNPYPANQWGVNPYPPNQGFNPVNTQPAVLLPISGILGSGAPEGIEGDDNETEDDSE